MRSRSTACQGRQAFDEQELVRVWILHHLQIVGEACRGLSEEFGRLHPTKSGRWRAAGAIAITPIIVGEAKTAFELSRELFQEGVLATGIGFPTVPKGKARVRTIVSAAHTRAELDRALEVFGRVGKKMGLV